MQDAFRIALINLRRTKRVPNRGEETMRRVGYAAVVVVIVLLSALPIYMLTTFEEATIEHNIEQDLLQVSYFCARHSLLTSNCELGANTGHGTEPAPALRQIGRCGRLSSSSLLVGCEEPYCRHRRRRILFRLGSRSTRSRKVYSSLFVRPFRNRLERFRSEGLVLA
jgi:hypothetical protein